MPDIEMAVDYGLNKVHFPAVVGSRLRARMTLVTVKDIFGGAQVTWLVTTEREGGDKPVYVAESVSRRY